MARSRPEWIGKTDDAKVPDHVRLRIFRAHGGRCHITGRKIRPGDDYDLDHIIALINGGQHRESNLAPALRDAHRAKTSEDVADKAHGDRAALRHFGLRNDDQRPGGFRKAPPQHNATRPLTKGVGIAFFQEPEQQ